MHPLDFDFGEKSSSLSTDVLLHMLRTCFNISKIFKLREINKSFYCLIDNEGDLRVHAFSAGMKKTYPKILNDSEFLVVLKKKVNAEEDSEDEENSVDTLIMMDEILNNVPEEKWGDAGNFFGAVEEGSSRREMANTVFAGNKAKILLLILLIFISVGGAGAIAFAAKNSSLDHGAQLALAIALPVLGVVGLFLGARYVCFNFGPRVLSSAENSYTDLIASGANLFTTEGNKNDEANDAKQLLSSDEEENLASEASHLESSSDSASTTIELS